MVQRSFVSWVGLGGKGKRGGKRTGTEEVEVMVVELAIF